MHICHVQTTFRKGAGATRRTSAILRGIKEAGYVVSLVVGKDSDDEKKLEECGIDVYRVPELEKYIAPRNEIGAFLKVRRLFLRLRPTVVHTHLAKAGIIGRAAARAAGVRIILHTVHGPSFPDSFSWLKRNLFGKLEQICSRWTTFTFFVGEELRRRYVTAGAAHPSRSIVIRSGRPKKDFDRLLSLDDASRKSIRQRLCQDDGAFLIACVGRLVPSKQQTHAIEILSKIRGIGYKAELVLIGDAFLEEEKSYATLLRELTKRLNMRNFVHFLGYCDDALELMAVADAVILTSKYEGLPNVAVEAALVGRPFVSYSVGGAREIVIEGKTGYIVPQGDQGVFVQRLERLIKDQNLRVDMGTSAQKVVGNSYDEDAMVAEKLRAYEVLLTTKKLRH